MKLKTFTVLFNLLYIHGVPGMELHDSRIRTVLHVSSISIMFFAHTHSLVLYILDFKACHDFNCSKVLLAVITFRVLLLVVWFSTYLERKKLNRIVRTIVRYESHYTPRITNFVISSFIIGNLVSLIYFQTSYAIFLLKNTKAADKIFYKITFGPHGWNPLQIVKTVIISLYYLITRAFLYYGSFLQSLFYATWSILLSQEIKECDEHHLTNWPSATSDKNRSVAEFLNSYGRIHKLVTLSESALSAHIFWLSSSNILIIFVQFSSFLGMYSYLSMNTMHGYFLSFSLVQSLSYFSTIYCASKVRERDLELRERVKNSIFLLRLSKQATESRKLLKEFIDSKQPLILSAGGIFKFTKGFLLQSIGLLITYNLLILQLNRSV